MIITELKDNEIFVFGSNLAGRHGAGAAKQALQWGAKYGEATGLHGQTYAIPTKDWRIQTLPLAKIEPYIKLFVLCTRHHPELKFLVTEIGCGLAGYQPFQIAPMFYELYFSDNVALPDSFMSILDNWRTMI